MKLEEVEKRLKVLEDIEEIKSMHNEYVFRLVNREWDAMAECFAENATADIGRHGLRKGKKEIARLFSEVIARINVGRGRDAHFVTQPVITVDGDKARGHWMLYIVISDKETGFARLSQGRYDVEYVREGGKWIFSALKYTSPWPGEPEIKP